jgi:hypothetical protein
MRSLRWAVAITLLMALLGVAAHYDRFDSGLRAEYFRNTNWTSPPVVTQIDGQPSTRHIKQTWGESVPDGFSITWTGWVLAVREGTYTFATDSDDGSWVFVDGQLVVDNGGRHESRRSAGSIHLERGAHPISILYFQDGGDSELEFLWGRGSSLETVPAWALHTRKGGSFARAMASVTLTFCLEASEWIWVGVLLIAAGEIARPWAARARGWLRRNTEWRLLRWLLAGSLVVNLIGVWWGLPGRWVQNELSPEFVLGGLAEHFSHGWFDVYPPFHYYVLSVVSSPALLLHALGRISFETVGGYTLLVVVSRLVSVAAGLGVVIATCVCGAYAFGGRAGLWAAAIIALTTPFVYYSKTANVDVPYLFWFALSLVFYLRLLHRVRWQDTTMFAVTATLAICTKDQAYGLYLVAPLAVGYQIGRANRHAGCSRPYWRAAIDRRLVLPMVAAAILFAACDNIPFNASGLLNHVRFITGHGSADYRVFEPTVEGRLALLRLTARLVQVSLGWPLLLVNAGGLMFAAATSRFRGVAVWLVLPVISYYLGFINVVLYNYDRFVLPICVVLALFGGFAVDRVLTAGVNGRSWRALCVAGVFGYTLLYATTVDVLMLRDSRYAVEEWLRAHVGRRDPIGMAGPRELLPRLDDFSAVAIDSVGTLERERPAYFVVNADYARAATLERPWGQLVAALQQQSIGYRLVLRCRRPAPWPWLPGAHPDLVGPRQEAVVFSTLRNINPTLEVFRRDVPGAAPFQSSGTTAAAQCPP